MGRTETTFKGKKKLVTKYYSECAKDKLMLLIELSCKYKWSIIDVPNLRVP